MAEENNYEDELRKFGVSVEILSTLRGSFLNKYILLCMFFFNKYFFKYLF